MYYDTETTGIRPDKDRIVEIAAYDPTTERTFSKLVNPGIPIPKEASDIHGITNDMVAQAPSFAEVGNAFLAFCNEDTILVAHNNENFDKHFLIQEFKRNQIELLNYDMVDSLKWARKYRPDLPRHNLQFLRQIYGFNMNNAHRALDDVMTLYQIFTVMIDDLLPEIVLDLLDEEKKSDTMPFGKYQGKPLSEVPVSYLKWLKNQGAFDKPENTELKSAIEKMHAL
ncbi:MAG: DUF3820 family protein [Chlamydiales bacterium]